MNLVEARFTTTATSPMDDLEVRTDERSFDVIWNPIAGASGIPVFPSAGDLALIALSDRGRAWVVTWTPYDT